MWKKILIAVLALSGLACFTIWYAFSIEPNRLTVKEIGLNFQEKKGSNVLKIVQFSDLHLGKSYSLGQLKKVVLKINSQSPDLIFFTGDLIDIAYQYEYPEEAASILQKLSASMGKYAIWGNHDYGGGGAQIYPSIMEKGGFTLLRNDTVSVPFSDRNKIVITGLDDGMLGNPDYTCIPEKGKNEFHILLVHPPDIIENLETNPFDLIAAGHSHGGQIRLPFIGSLLTPPLAKNYTEGLYEIGNSKLYVNTGLGTTKINARLFNPPNITVFNVYLN